MAQVWAARPLQFRVLSSTGRYRHLGSVERGLRTACGRTFEADMTQIEMPSSSDVTCLSCMATQEYARAVVSGQVTDMRTSTS